MTSIYFDGGIGDYLVYDSHWHWQPDRIYWASRARPTLQPLIERVHPQIEHVDLWAEHSPEAQTYGEKTSLPRPDPPSDAEDWRAIVAFPRCRSLKFVGSSFLRYPSPLADLSRYGLPRKYVVCQHDTPFNQASMRARRQITAPEWEWIRGAIDLPVVVVGSGDSYSPPAWTLNLCGKTDMATTIEVLRGSAGYYGIDSWVACLACQLHRPENIAIKYDGGWYRRNIDLYTAPISSDAIVHKILGQPLHPYPDGVTIITKRPILFAGESIAPGYAIEVPADLAAEYIRLDLADRWDPTSAIEAAAKLRAIFKTKLDTSLGVTKCN